MVYSVYMNKDKKAALVSSVIGYSLLMALVPFTIGLVTEVLISINNVVQHYFWEFSWPIKIIIYVILGLIIALWRIEYAKDKISKEDDNVEENFNLSASLLKKREDKIPKKEIKTSKDDEGWDIFEALRKFDENPIDNPEKFPNRDK